MKNIEKVFDKKTKTHKRCVKEWKLKHQDQVRLHRQQEYLNKKDRLKLNINVKNNVLECQIYSYKFYEKFIKNIQFF